ncbi:MAG TPA: tRNA (adenosine(37)-N6)-threonylcarbamoyltransferase complex dimerization subunit type 1 TsaB [Candidatus Omnitrophota bacterium]|nr:tRNA (adenosine(37)-N6)-threonylcarbamoyltransferase complex dimerization subunit type 1 TsaB [Candidatus Omnitrophota bacterium]HPS36948.1 tRNA (adenosine(37)-N6)-threonylcarbamoyltransferase complex dimerization subunit type 1 TsaB [Candidatus Omnitrophota bacterium]
MNLLAIETSGPVLSVAVKKGRAKVRQAVLKGFSRHAETLLPLIDRLLKKERFKLRDIDAFLIGRGPGSFTGLRVGFATLKGLITLRKKPCYGAFSLDMIAGGIPACKNGKLHVCLDAKRDKLYTRFYRYSKKGWTPQGAAAVRSFEDMAQALGETDRIAGDGLTAGKNKLLGLLKKDPCRVPERYWHPRAATLIRWFEEKNTMLKPLTRPKELLPVYLRLSEPEEKHREKKERS